MLMENGAGGENIEVTLFVLSHLTTSRQAKSKPLLSEVEPLMRIGVCNSP
jgi:hypothetical protein